jgi:hypothetical protein
MEKEFIECKCHSLEHLLVIDADFSLEYGPELYFCVHLSPLPWHKRIINAAKYIFGHRSNFGDFDEFLLDSKNCDKLIKLLKRYKKTSDLLAQKNN